MPESIAAQAGSTVVAPGFELAAAQAPQPTNELGKDEFLKLLVAQLKYQDPLEPSTSDEFIATSAQFTVVEKLEELTLQGENTALINSLSTASSLVGRQVEVNGGEGPVAATVQRSSIVSGEVTLDTDIGSFGLDQVASVGLPTPTGDTPPTASQTSEQGVQQ